MKFVKLSRASLIEGNSLENLFNVIEPPQNFYVEGQDKALKLLLQLPQRGFAVVGTRYPSPRSVQEVRRIISELEGTGLVIISGLAKGIDAEAHKAAIASGLHTIAVLGSGITKTYPPENHELREKIISNQGLVVSEFEPDSIPFPSNFLNRNRIISGWSQGTWIVEASYKSGALSTAKWTRGQEKFCYATPCFPGDPRLAGNQSLIDDYNAYPMWGSHSLGSCWIELAARRKNKRKNKNYDQSCNYFFTSKQNLLIQKVSDETFERGGLHINELLDWALQERWSTDEFYVELQKALDAELLVNDNGLVLKNI